MIDPYEYELGIAVGYHLHVETCEDQTSWAKDCPCGRFIRARDANDAALWKLQNDPPPLNVSAVQLEWERAEAREHVALLQRERRAQQEAPLIPTTSAERAARPRISWLVEGLVPHGPTIGIVYGVQGSNKTFGVLDLCLSILNQRDEWMGKRISWAHADSGEICVGDKAVYILGEGVVGFPAREKAWTEAFGGTSDNLLTVEHQDASLVSEAGLRRIVTMIDTYAPNPAVIVYDTQGLTSALGADENSRTEMRAVYARAKSLAAKYGCLVLMMTHPGADPRFIGRPAGATTQMQDADLVLQFTWSDKQRRGTVVVRKVKEGETGWKWLYTRRPSGDALVLDYAGLVEGVEDNHGDPDEGDDAINCPDPEKMALVVNYLGDDTLGEEARNHNSILAAVGGQTKTLKPVLDYMEKAGVVGTTPGPRGARYYWLASPIES